MNTQLTRHARSDLSLGCGKDERLTCDGAVAPAVDDATRAALPAPLGGSSESSPFLPQFFKHCAHLRIDAAALGCDAILHAFAWRSTSRPILDDFFVRAP